MVVEESMNKMVGSLGCDAMKQLTLYDRVE